MTQKPKFPLIARLAFFLGGLATLTLVGALLWAGFTSPLSSRMPVPSPDGRYFAYFNRTEFVGTSGTESYELIISKPQGGLLARIEAAPGRIIWSNANHLVTFDPAGGQATLIANAEDRFIVLARIPLSSGGDPQWAPDGSKLACLRRIDSGAQLAIFDVQQPQAFPIPLPPDFRISRAQLVAWSPVSEQLYFLNVEGKEAALLSVDVRSGALRVVAKGGYSPRSKLPQLSPDGTRIFWGLPENVVLEAVSGERVYPLPADARALWSPWSGDSREFYFVRQEPPGSIFSHNFVSSSDQIILSGVRGNGFFDSDGGSYFFRETASSAETPAENRGDLAKKSAGWRQADRGLPPQALDNIELWPWERTVDGLILARRDESTRVRYGLYDPDTNRLEAFTFPTDRDDLLAQVKSSRLVIATVALFTFLAVLVLAKRPEIKAGRAFPLLLFLAMTLGVGGVVGGSLAGAGETLPYRISPAELGDLGWGVSLSLPERVFSQAHQTLAWLWALLPLSILNFGLAFPDRNPFLHGRETVQRTLYGMATLPVAAMLAARFVPGISAAIVNYMVVVAVAVAAIVWALALGASHERPPDKSGRHAVRWFVAALGLLAGGYVAHLAARKGMSGLPEGLARESLGVLEASCFVLAAWVAPTAMAYSVAARKPQGLGRFLSACFRHFLMGVPSVLGFLIAWAAAGLVISGSLWAFSPLAIVIAVLVAVIAVLPFRGRLRVAIDRRFDRARFHSQERLAAFAQSLPHTVDRGALALQLEEEVIKTLRARWCLLFVLDRATRKLTFQRGKTALSTEARHVTFSLDEPLCEYLRDVSAVFEPVMATGGGAVAEVMASSGSRLQKLQAEVVLGLRRSELLGLIVLGPKATRDLYDSEELDSFRVIARETAAALENIELFTLASRDREMRKDLEDASNIQTKLLPARVPSLTSGQFAASCYPARSTGGDYYDFVALPGRKTGLVMCDVAGKGMAAALLTASVEKILGSHIPASPSLTELVQSVNRELIAASPAKNLITLFYGVYDDASRRMEYVNAGHPAPLLLASGGAQFLEPTGLPLGLFDELVHQPRSIVLPAGSMLLIHSDGVVDAKNVAGDRFGKERLAGALFRGLDSDADRALGRVVADIRDFEGDALLEDDQTFILLKIYAE